MSHDVSYEHMGRSVRFWPTSDKGLKACRAYGLDDDNGCTSPTSQWNDVVKPALEGNGLGLVEKVPTR